ncbi:MULTISPECIES: HAD family hydrolase [unclassified Pseudomonas]|jgi:haloacid dehalogenase superfamily, subfamily IA, variant 3 with third motif having DD or ED/haloacid dehalogenase superfamily, subfamily IA, variant 1 with third motif having Dx(3-4)D or Dx(3-4)E|uniref:HAD family hydrolase n=1 Tax=unclassified Pseudomonas TaxID=196821 RepID=UPI0003FAAF0A|nr:MULTISPECIES: HAD family hydrolase [unclassified Pseudomonas]ATP51403.1 HAD family hydrolase [Pseudomonas putida]MDE4540936.1 HAD family hydrolase [Pseudomonas sp. ITEM 17296]GHS83282.1 haloacid dehalogenase [Pseudomonas sp. PAGU 2196]GLO55155.1 haloacid dehalogenase [Pseudomonas putida]
MKKPYELLIFDWDGTLADSIGRIVEAMNAAAERAGEAPSHEEAVKGIIGLALGEAIHTLYPHLTPAALERFRQHYADIYMALDQQPSPLFEGVVESLDAFRAEGYRLAVATGKARRGLDRVLKANGWEQFFDITRAADETRGKPHPLMLEEILGHCGVEPGRALMVGDSAFDLQMASNAGMHSVAVGYGAMSLQALAEFGPQLCIDHFSQLREWLGRSA